MKRRKPDIEVTGESSVAFKEVIKQIREYEKRNRPKTLDKKVTAVGNKIKIRVWFNR